VQTQLDEETVDSSSSIDDDDDDDDMPQLSPVADVSMSSSVCPPPTRHASTSVTSTPQPRSSAEKYVSAKSATVDDSQLYCICHTPYDETKYAVASSCHMTKLCSLNVTVKCNVVLNFVYSIVIQLSFSVTVIYQYCNSVSTLILRCQ